MKPKGPVSIASRLLGPIVPRDTDASAFAVILDDLLGRVPAAYAAALVDGLGETVDYTGRGEPFDLRLAAAHLQIVIANLTRIGAVGAPRWVIVRGSRRSVAATVLPEDYVLVLLLRPRAAFSVSARAVSVCTRALAAEAGWKEPEKADEMHQRNWFPVLVETDRRGRPTRIGDERIAVEVLGTLVGLAVRERGFRVRTARGTELMLVREPQKRWYADEPV